MGITEAKQTLSPEVRLVAQKSHSQETHPFIVPEPQEILGIAVNVFNATIFDIRTGAIASAVASHEKIWVRRVFPPVITVLEVLKVFRYAWDFLAVYFINNRHRSRPSFAGCFVPLFL